MRSEKTSNWVKLLPTAVKLLNLRPLKRLGGLAPGSINTMLDDVEVREAVENSCETTATHLPSVKEQNELQKKYENSKAQFQVNSFVYLDNKEKTFAKSYNAKVSIEHFQKYSRLSVVNKT